MQFSFFSLGHRQYSMYVRAREAAFRVSGWWRREFFMRVYRVRPFLPGALFSRDEGAYHYFRGSLADGIEINRWVIDAEV